MTRRGIDAIFATDDREAARLASAHEVRVVSTWDLLRLAARHQFVDRDTLWAYLQTFRSADRGGPSNVRGRSDLDSWLT